MEQAALTRATPVSQHLAAVAAQQKLTTKAKVIAWNAKTAPILISFVRTHVDAVLRPVRQYSLGLRKSC
jgi:hypothetical protein